MKTPNAPLPFDDARALLRATRPAPTPVAIPLETADKAFLAEDITAPFPIPRYTNSAMDGFAVRAEDTQNASPDTPITLKITATIAAGTCPNTPLAPHTCCAIMTGAQLPPGANAIVKIEDTQHTPDSCTLQTPVPLGAHVRYAGDTAQKGDLLLPAHTAITPPVAGVLASLDITTPVVFARPKIAVLITGDEIVPPGTPPPEGKMTDAVAPALSSLIQRDGFTCAYLSYVADDPHALQKEITLATQKADCLLIVGGASMGAYDYVQDVCATLHIETILWRVAIKPGKPFWAGKKDDLRVFNLPGNPVSVLVTYLLFVREYLLQWAGCPPAMATLEKRTARLTAALEKTDPRREFVRGVYTYNDAHLMVTPIHARRSDMLTSMCHADCLIVMPEDCSHFPEKTLVETLVLPWYLPHADAEKFRS